MPVFKLKREEKIETWWIDHFEIEAESLEDAVGIILEGNIDPYNSEPMVDFLCEPFATEIYDDEGNLVYESRQL